MVEIVKFHIAVSDNCLCSNSSVSASGDYLYVAWYGATACTVHPLEACSLLVAPAEHVTQL